MGNKGSHKQEYRFMVGVLDSKTHNNIFYAKNLNMGTFDSIVKELKKKLPEIENLIKSDKIKKEDFDYEQYFGPEIIP